MSLVDQQFKAEEDELALGNAPGARSDKPWTEKQASALVDEAGQANDGAYDETTPAKWTFPGWKWQVSHFHSFVGSLRALA